MVANMWAVCAGFGILACSCYDGCAASNSERMVVSRIVDENVVSRYAICVGSGKSDDEIAKELLASLELDKAIPPLVELRCEWFGEGQADGSEGGRKEAGWVVAPIVYLIEQKGEQVVVIRQTDEGEGVVVVEVPGRRRNVAARFAAQQVVEEWRVLEALALPRENR